MGCYSLGKIVSRAFGKCSGKERRRASRVVVLSPPPSYLYSRPRTVVKSANFSSEIPIITIPPNPNQVVTLPKPHATETSTHQSSSATAIPVGPDITSKAPIPARVHFEEPSRVRFAAGAEPHKIIAPSPNLVQPDPAPSQRDPPHDYIMSPLPKWEERPQRREYFGGEFHYYPTPIREGIYNIATDANRLTTIFSEENPNACSIV